MNRQLWRVLAGGLLAGAVALGLGRFAFTPILPVMQAEYGFSNHDAGWLSSANLIGYLIGVLWAGYTKREEARFGLMYSGLLAAFIAALCMPFSDSFPVWFILRLISGIAGGWIFVVAASLVIPYLSNRGHPSFGGLHYGGVGIGIMAAGLLVGWAARSMGSDAAWYWVAGLSLLFSIYAAPVLWTTKGDAARHAAHQPIANLTGTGYPLILVAIAYFCEGFGYIISGTFMVQIINATPETAYLGNYAWVVVGLFAFPSALFWAWLMQRKGPRFAMVAAHLTQALGIALPAISTHPLAILLGAALFGGTFLGIVAIALGWGRMIAPQNIAKIIALLSAGYGVGQIIAPPIAAMAATLWGWNAALWLAYFVILAPLPLLYLRPFKRS